MIFPVEFMVGFGTDRLKLWCGFSDFTEVWFWSSFVYWRFVFSFNFIFTEFVFDFNSQLALLGLYRLCFFLLTNLAEQRVLFLALIYPSLVRYLFIAPDPLAERSPLAPFTASEKSFTCWEKCWENPARNLHQACFLCTHSSKLHCYFTLPVSNTPSCYSVNIMSWSFMLVFSLFMIRKLPLPITNNSKKKTLLSKTKTFFSLAGSLKYQISISLLFDVESPFYWWSHFVREFMI